MIKVSYPAESAISFQDFCKCLCNPVTGRRTLQALADEFSQTYNFSIPSPQNETLEETNPAPYQSDQRSY